MQCNFSRIQNNGNNNNGNGAYFTSEKDTVKDKGKFKDKGKPTKEIEGGNNNKEEGL